MYNEEKIYTTDEYNNWAQEHDEKTVKYDKESRALFYSFFTFETKGKKLLDIACGSGCVVSGVDGSQKEVDIANKRLGEKSVKQGLYNKLPFENNSFDIVVSKYAPQAFESIEDFYKEASRVLKPDGYFIILATHPMRHFLEKVDKPRDYFKTEVVVSWIYEHTLPLKEWSHTFNDYYSKFFLDNFTVEQYIETTDTKLCVEWVDGETYPGYFIFRAKKKSKGASNEKGNFFSRLL
jgi:ubiquinone/menaquinone biosynthesis C-methylase UbiE